MTTNKQQDVQSTVQDPPVSANNGGADTAKPIIAGNDSQQKTDSAKLSAEIKRTWGKLTDEEIASSEKDPNSFYAAVKQKYGLSKDDVEKRMKEAKSACATTPKE